MGAGAHRNPKNQEHCLFRWWSWEFMKVWGEIRRSWDPDFRQMKHFQPQAASGACSELKHPLIAQWG